MPSDDKIKELESEFKLIKGELRQTMVNVRDYLLNFRIPTAPPPQPAEEVDGLIPEVSAGAGMEAPSEEITETGMPPEPEEMTETLPPEQAMTPGGGTDTMTDSAMSQNAMDTTDTMDTMDTSLPDELGGDLPEDPFASPPEQTAFDDAFAPPPDDTAPATEDVLEIADDEAAPEAADSDLLDIVEETPDDAILPEPEQTPPAAAPERAAREKAAAFDPNNLPVNLLTNLIRWVATAKARIGADQLPTFLEIYSSSGQLSTELKDFIMHLVDEIEETATENTNASQDFIRLQMANLLEICSSSGQLSTEMKTGIMHLTDMLAGPASEANPVDVWSQLMIELQGIIAEGGEPLRPTNMPWQEDTEEAASDDAAAEENDSGAPTDDTARLKLVLPVNEVGNQEFVLNLTPETNRENEAEG